MRLVLALGLASCLAPETVECLGGLLCPAGKACAPQLNRCVLPEQLSACLAATVEGDPCVVSGSTGVCQDGVCELAGSAFGCGNGFLESGELCDDGNTRSGDGCSADCRSLESCGNGVTDQQEACDCGDGSQPLGAGCNGPNADPLSATCSRACLLHGCGDGVFSAPEACEGTQLGGATCEALGGVGTLACAANCTLDLSRCHRWTALPSSGPNPLRAVWTSAPLDVYVAGGYTAISAYPGGSVLLHYDGSTWSNVSLGVTSSFSAMWGSGAGNVFVGGDGGSLFRHDGSAWSKINSGTSATFNAIWGSGPGDVFALTYTRLGSGFGSSFVPGVVHLSAGTWSPMSIGGMGVFNDLWGSGPADVFIVGGSGSMLRYNGSAWAPISSGTTASLSGIWGTGPANIYAVGTEGTIVHYDGSSWSAMSSGTTLSLNGIWGSGPADVFAVGAAGTIVHYDGSSWAPMPSGTTNALYRISGSGPGAAFAVGVEGTILQLR